MQDGITCPVQHSSLNLSVFVCKFMRYVVGGACCSTFVCPTEIIAFSDNIEQFQSISCDVVGVSTDSHFSHLAWVNTARKVVASLSCSL